MFRAVEYRLHYITNSVEFSAGITQVVSSLNVRVKCGKALKKQTYGQVSTEISVFMNWSRKLLLIVSLCIAYSKIKILPTLQINRHTKNCQNIKKIIFLLNRL